MHTNRVYPPKVLVCCYIKKDIACTLLPLKKRKKKRDGDKEKVMCSDLKPQVFPDRKWLGALEPSKTEADLRGESLRDNFFQEVGRTGRATGERMKW